jgi:hypothetical protein
VSTRHDQDPPAVESDDPDQLRAGIEDTRADLGETVEALSAKADVKAQLGHKKEQLKGHLEEKQGEAKARRKPALISLAVLGAWMLRRRRKRRKEG